MSKFSVVIPTLWMSERIHSLLESLINSTKVGEIIIIDNAGKFGNYYKTLPKVKVLTPSFNIYVNPAWNYGIKYSTNNCVALINDDITFDTRIFEEFDENELKSKGFIGMSSENYTNEVYNPQLEPWKGEVVLHGWGCLILFHKENWIEIPNEMKIWYGDNFMREINPAPSYILKGLPIQTEMSTTSNDSKWDNVKEMDSVHWIDNFKLKAHERIKSIIENI